MKSKLAILTSVSGYAYNCYCFVPIAMAKEQLDIAVAACRNQARKNHGDEWVADDLRQLLLQHNIVMLTDHDILKSGLDWDADDFTA